MRRWPVLACIALCAANTGAAHADPFHGAEPGMTRAALADLITAAGARLECRDVGPIMNPVATGIERCSADMPATGDSHSTRLEVLIAPGPQAAPRVAFIRVEGSSTNTEAALVQLTARWGNPIRTLPTTTNGETAYHWSTGARGLVLTEACRRGASYCIEYSENSWSRRAARAAGMDVALPQP